MSIKTIADGVLYRNPNPTQEARNAWHPRLVRTEDGQIIATFDIADSTDSLDYGTYISRSSDNGNTWEPPTPLLDAALVQHPTRLTMHLARTSLMSNGEFVAVVGRYFREEDDNGFVCDETMGLCEMELLLARSRDLGRTWQPLEKITPPLEGPGFEVAHPIIELQDGRWVAPLATWHDQAGRAPNGHRAVAFVSSDQGKSWPTYLDVMEDGANGIIYFEQGLAQLTDGRLLATVWAYDQNTRQTRGIDYAVARGDRFTPHRPTPLKGETAKLIALPDGRALCVYRGLEPVGLVASIITVNDDDTCEFSEPQILWKGESATAMFGVEGPGKELKELKLGSPHGIVIADDEVFIAFWCCGEDVFHIRWVRVRV